MKVVLATDHSDPEFVNELRTEFENIEFVTSNNREEEKNNIKDADIYCGIPTREVFLSAKKLQWIQCIGTGVDAIMSIPEVLDSDVVLTNCRGPHAAPMADHTMGMVTTLAHKLNEMWDDQKNRVWDTSKYTDSQINLTGTTMGILALGDIGNAVASRAHGFGMDVYAVDKHPRPAPPVVKEIWGLEKLDQLIEISDWFVITAPLTNETRGLIDRRRVELLKPGAFVIAISRGNIIDEEALIDGLMTGKIAGAGLDVTAIEPLPQSSPLWEMKNVVLSPHASAMTASLIHERRAIFKSNLRHLIANEPFVYTVDKESGF